MNAIWLYLESFLQDIFSINTVACNLLYFILTESNLKTDATNLNQRIEYCFPPHAGSWKILNFMFDVHQIHRYQIGSLEHTVIIRVRKNRFSLPFNIWGKINPNYFCNVLGKCSAWYYFIDFLNKDTCLLSFEQSRRNPISYYFLNNWVTFGMLPYGFLLYVSLLSRRLVLGLVSLGDMVINIYINGLNLVFVVNIFPNSELGAMSELLVLKANRE